MGISSEIIFLKYRAEGGRLIIFLVYIGVVDKLTPGNVQIGAYPTIIHPTPPSGRLCCSLVNTRCHRDNF